MVVINQNIDKRKYLIKNSELHIKPSLTVIVPTRNEAGNVKPLLHGIQSAFRGYLLNIIFVDDSTDDTPIVIDKVKNYFQYLNIRTIHRPENQRVGGLGGAVVRGLMAAKTEYACVMDGDLQHPPELIPELYKKAINADADLVIATRRNKESKVQGLNFFRDLVSKGLDLIGRIFFPRQLKNVSDPLTGFFLVRKDSLNLTVFNPIGFKILLEILVRHPELRKSEVPFHFGDRLSGESKASISEVWKYLCLLWTLRFGQKSIRFLQFALVGASGILINTAVIYFSTDILNIFYLVSAGIATIASTISNFFLTERWVYKVTREQEIEGRSRRLILFFVMNLIALALRAPMIYLFTSVFSLYYVISNLISIGILTILRFFLSDNIIWDLKFTKKYMEFIKE